MPSETSLSAPLATDVVTLENVSLGYGGKPVVEAVSGRVARGALLALVGPNGAGKSTLLRAFAGLHRVSSGVLRTAHSGRAAYLPQHTPVDHAFPMSTIDFVAMGLWREIGFWKPLDAARRKRAREALTQVDLGDAAQQRIGTLSGGQFRRALFARAMLQNADLILLDEPFAGIDAATQQDLLTQIEAWHAQGRTVVAALHNLAQVRALFPQTLLLARRAIAWDDTAEALSDDNLAIAFGKDARADA